MTGPTFHATEAQDEQVTTNTTWSKCGNPHVVRGLVNVAGGATLTIDPGVAVRFDRTSLKNAVIRVGYLSTGALVVNGSAAEPVTMESNASGPAAGDYIGVHLADGSAGSRIKYLTMRHCGAPNTQGPSLNGCILAQGDGTPTSNEVVFDHVTIDGSETQGLVLGSGAAFGAGSGALTVRNGGSYAIAIQPEETGSLPAGGAYTGNTPNAIRLLSPAFVRRTQSWINPGVPYVPEAGIDVTAEDDAAPPPVLTLAAGSTFRMPADQMVRVGYVFPGALVAVGTAASPITFTSDAATPAPADWRVMDFANEATPNASRLDYVVVEYAGGFNGYSPGDSANITVRTPSQGDFITNSTIRFSGGCGITVPRFVNEEPIFTTDFTALGNTFSNNAGAPQCGPYTGSRR